MDFFLSSTFVDLVDHRAAAADALERLGHRVVRMETFGARPEEPTTACLEEVCGCDALLGVYAHRYGYVPAGTSASVTEQEYDEARRHHKPCFSFVIDPLYAWPPGMVDRGRAARRLATFKKRVEAETVRATFTSPENLAFQTATSVGAWRHRREVTTNTGGPGSAQFLSRLSRALDITTLLSAVLTDLRLITCSPRNQVSLVGCDDGGRHVVVVAHDWPDDGSPWRLAPMEGLRGWAILNGTVGNIPALPPPSTLLHIAPVRQTQSAVAVPVPVRDRFVGALYSESADTAHYADSTVAELLDLARALGQVLPAVGWRHDPPVADLPSIRLLATSSGAGG
jgi:hypothetical protein